MPRKTYITAINEALFEEMRRDETVFLMGQDVRIGVFAGTRGLHKAFGDRRVIDTPISELAVAGAGIGAAVTGLRPVVDLMFGTFLYLAFDQIANQAGRHAATCSVAKRRCRSCSWHRMEAESGPVLTTASLCIRISCRCR